jgi:hypothetical protein
MNFIDIKSIDSLIKEADINNSIKDDRINALVSLIDTYETTGQPIDSKGLASNNKLFIDKSNINKLRTILDQLRSAAEEGLDAANLVLTLEASLGRDIVGEKYLIGYIVGSPDVSLDDAVASIISSIQDTGTETGQHSDKMKSTDGGSGIDGKNSWAFINNTWNKFAEIINFFNKIPDPTDSEIHSFAERENIDPHRLEEEIYSLLGALLGKGKSNLEENKDKEYDKDQEEKGIEVEQEHIEGAKLPPAIMDLLAKKITNDHQSENEVSDEEYYDRLIKDEKDMENLAEK